MNRAVTASIVRRNLMVYFRDRAQVFFTFLAPLILLMLYVLFLGRMQVDQLAAEMPGTDPDDISGFIYAWVLTGLVLITTISASLAALVGFVTDRATGRFKEFRVSPVREMELVVAYLISAVIISLVLSLAVLLVGTVALGWLYGAWASATGYVVSVVYTVLLCLVFSSMSALAVTFVSSEGGYSGLSTMVGTLSGFLSFVYIPVGVVAGSVASILNAMPFAQGAVLLRGSLAEPALERMLAAIPEPQYSAQLEFIRSFYGFDASIGSFQLTAGFIAALMVVLTLVFKALAAWRIRRLTTLDMR